MRERRVRPTLLHPLWSAAGYALGAATALLGQRAALACTVAIEDVRTTLEAVRAAGGQVLMEPAVIPGVGELAFFADLDGNVCGAMHYEQEG